MSFKYFRFKFKPIPVHVWILVGIILVGIFLRVYRFSDWLLFNPDQARDAGVVSDFINGNSHLPFLGPVAGGTFFKLGPIFYYFQIISAKVFGDTPQSVAYPSLLSSILAIPLLFFFLKKYFSKGISLLLTALMAISYFSVFNSRFAWNPNMIPFFVLLFLFGILEMADEKNKKNIIWPILVGVAIGVGMQLHTLLLLIMPMVIIITLFYFWNKKVFTWRGVSLIIFFIVLFNAPQILNEIKTYGQNIGNFFVGAGKQSDKGGDLFSGLSLIASCQVQYNIHMLSSFENIEICGDIFKTPKKFIKKYGGIPGNFEKRRLVTVGMLGSVFFTIIGYFLLGYYYWKEKDKRKKEFLGLVFLFNLICFAFFVPVASHITMRYYIIILFLPFVFLGLFFKFLLEKFRGISGKIVIFIVIIILFFSNLFVLRQAALPLFEKNANDGENSIFSETLVIANYLAEKAQLHKIVYINGDRIYFRRFFDPLVYLLKKENIELLSFDNTISIKSDAIVFYIAESDSKKYKKAEKINELEIVSRKKFNKVTLFILNNNLNNASQ